MPGERTPDIGGGRNSDDNISLREHMQRQIEDVRHYIDTKDEAARVYFERLISETRVQLNERYETQTKAIEAARVAAEKAVSAALAAAEQAVAKAEVSTDKRFAAVNEFRAQLADQARTFMAREESISRHERTAEAMVQQGARHDNEQRLLRERVESDMKQLRERHESDMAAVNSRLDLNLGQSKGVAAAWGYLIAAIGLLATIFAIIAFFIGRS